MHGPAPAPAVAGLLAEQLRHRTVHTGSFRQAVPVSAVGGCDIVRILQRQTCTHAAGLLAHVQVNIACQLAAGKALGGLRFESPDQRHSPISLTVPARCAGCFFRFQ
ncbi:hypothetical protein SDC9_64112 [bioreactor metagenome]|uniref:Uncharacterized protein n=1 Tax=bioreactor metagenome TaxID=1076179 RepID=A0A644XNK1_9ZZZZ